MITLQDIIKSSPTQNFSNIYIFIDNNCVCDYKEGDGSLLLISQGLCEDTEKVSLQELLEYSNELDYPEDILTLECEYERQLFKKFVWLENNLILSF